MVKLLSFAVALAFATAGCLDAPPDTATGTTPAHVPEASPDAAPADVPPADVPPADVPPADVPLTGVPSVLVDERVSLLQAKFPIRPSLVLDEAGRPQVFVTLWRDGEDIAGFMRRDADGWHHVEVVRGPSGGIGYGGGLAYGHLDPGDGGLEVWIWRDADGTTAVDNRTDVFMADGDGWRVVDSVPDVEVHQVLRAADGGLVALLAHYGGNGYVVEPTDDATPWRATFFSVPTYRPVGVLTPEGTIAALARLELTHFEGPREVIAFEDEPELAPLGPARGPDGHIHVLRRQHAALGDRLTLSTRARRDDWSHTVVAAEPEVPDVTSCPDELGAPCAYTTARATAAGLVVLPSGAPVWLGATQPIEVAYHRQCLVHDSEFMGCAMPPCIDEGGPAGPWLEWPAVTPTGPATLIVDGVPLSPEVPPSFQPALTLDAAGRLHIAWLEQDALRYVVIDLL